MIKKEIINRSIDYIICNIDQDISVDEVAEYCNFSKYHFSRMFKDETGESIYAFIKRMKMNQSAVRIKTEKGKSITDIGLDYGYSSTNYSQVFKKQHQISPSKYREVTKDTYLPNPFYYDKASDYPSFSNYKEEIQVMEFDDTTVVYERYIGNYAELKDGWIRFIKKYEKYIREDTQFMERAYDDPTITALGQCIYDMCFPAEPGYPLGNVTVIAGGIYAVYSYKGAVQEIYTTIQGMFHKWLPNSGYEMNGNYVLNRYRVLDHNRMYVELDICIPVKRA